MKNENKKYITNIVEIIKKFNMKILNMWVEDNCIYAEVKKLDNSIEIEGLYAGSDLDPQNVYDVFHDLKNSLMSL